MLAELIQSPPFQFMRDGFWQVSPWEIMEPFVEEDLI